MDFADIKKTLEKNGFAVSCFENKEAAADYLEQQIAGKSVAFGGSVTVREMGLYEKLATRWSGTGRSRKVRPTTKCSSRP